MMSKWRENDLKTRFSLAIRLFSRHFDVIIFYSAKRANARAEYFSYNVRAVSNNWYAPSVFNPLTPITLILRSSFER